MVSILLCGFLQFMYMEKKLNKFAFFESLDVPLVSTRAKKDTIMISIVENVLNLMNNI